MKLTRAQINEARRALANGATISDVAKAYGLTWSGAARHAGKVDVVASSTGAYPKAELDVSWMPRAACLDEDPELFYPGSGRAGLDAPGVQRALAVCQSCPVRQECLTYAFAFEYDARWDCHGIFGGLTARERRQLIREHQEKAS